MAGSVTQRTWISKSSSGRKVKRTAWGFTTYQGTKRVKKFDAAWDREAAEQALARFQLGLPGPRRADSETPAGSGMTFSQAVERYLQERSRKKSASHDALYLRHLQAALGASTPLGALTASRISGYKASRIAAANPKTGRPYAPASINRPLACLRSLLKLAAEEWQVIPSVPRIRLERETGRERHLEDAEAVRLLEACKASTNAELLPFVQLLLGTGARRGEALKLTWSHVDFAAGMVTFTSSTTKTGKSRSVPMTQDAYAALSSLSGRVGRVFWTRSFRTAFERAVDRAGLDNVHLHDLRHTYASRLVQRGAQLRAVQELLGHSSITMTQRYSHLSPAHLRETVGLLDRAILGPQRDHEQLVGVAFEEGAR
jgi:integrase